MTTSTHRHAPTIVVGHDGREPADRALDWAAREALARGSRLSLLEAVPFAPVLPGPSTPTRPRGARTGSTLERTAVEQAVADLRDRFPRLAVDHVVVHGDPVIELIEAGRHADLVVVGSRGEGAMRRIPSAQVGARLARHATCPVAVVPHYRAGVVRRGVLAGISVRAHLPEVLDLAYAHAELHDLPLTIVHASRDATGASQEDRVRWLSEAVGGYATEHPNVRVQVRVESGHPTSTLLRLAEQMDLLVVGRHAAGGGSPAGHVRTGIADRAPCPVVVVPPAG